MAIQRNQWGEPIDQFGNPIPEAYLPPDYYDDQQSPYPDDGYGGDTPYYPGGAENPNPTPDPNPPSAPSAPTTPAADPSNPQAFIQSLLSNVPYGAQGLLGLRQQLQAAGYNLWVDGNGGARGIITDRNGKNWNVLGQGEGNNWWSNPTGAGWNVREYQAGGGGGGTTPISINPEYTDPFSEPAPEIPTEPTYTPGQFDAPTAETILQDPSYLWRLSQGRGALENSAAARGTLNSGGTLKDILNYGQQAGSQEYSNVWGRQFDKWNADESNNLAKFRADKDVTDTTYNNAWTQYLGRRDTYWGNQNNAWKKYLEAAQLGASA